MPFAHRPDARIWWEQSGTGDPVLLIMGHAYGADMWHRTAPDLAASYRVIRFDNRGVGRSSDPPGPYPVRLMADDALAVLDMAGAASAHVYGVSLGGAIALQLALDHPGRVRSLILGCTAASAGARLVMFPDAGHAYITDVTQAANQEVLHFLADGSSTSPRLAAGPAGDVMPTRDG